MKKKQSNSRKVILGFIIALAAIAVILIVLSILEENDQADTNSAADEYEETSNEYGDDNDDSALSRRLYYVGNSEMYEILNDTSGEGFFIYIGRPTCPHCAAFEPTLEETLQYLDRDMRYFQTDLASLANDESEMTMNEIVQAMGVTGVPRVVYVENGVVIDALSGNQPMDVVLSFFDDNGGLN